MLLRSQQQCDLCWNLTRPWCHSCSTLVNNHAQAGSLWRVSAPSPQICNGSNQWRDKEISNLLSQGWPNPALPEPQSTAVTKATGAASRFTEALSCDLLEYTHGFLYLKLHTSHHCYSFCWPRLNALWDISIVHRSRVQDQTRNDKDF